MIQNAHLRTIIEEEQAKAKRDKGNTSEFDIALAKSSAVILSFLIWDFFIVIRKY